MKVLALLIFISFHAWSQECSRNDFAVKYTVEAANWDSHDEFVMLSALCETSQFTGKINVDEIWVNDIIMGFEFKNRLTLIPRYKPLKAPTGFKQTLENTRNIWVHEYGHAVLRKHVLENNPVWLRHLVRNQERFEIQDKYQQCIRTHCNELKTILNKLMNFWEPGEQEVVSDFLAIYSAYDEMYADLVAVLYSENPSVISQSLEFPGIDISAKMINARRDFAIDHKHSDDVSDRIYHGIMAYSRHWIWKNLLHENAALSLVEKTAILYKVEKAIELEVAQRFENGEIALSNRQINERFINRLNSL